MRDGKASTCLCVMETSQYVLFVTRQCHCQCQRNTICGDTENGAKYANLNHQEKQQKVQELKDSLHSQQNMFVRVAAKNGPAVKARFIVAEEIPRSSVFFRRHIFEAVYAEGTVM